VEHPASAGFQEVGLNSLRGRFNPSHGQWEKEMFFA